MEKLDSAQIRLRIAGIFYDRTFKASDISQGSMTIENVMEFARLNTKLDYGFEYRAAALDIDANDSIKSMIQIAHRIDDPFISLGGKRRPGGVYKLIETATPAGVVAWQYYVVNKDGVSRSTNQIGDIVSPARPADSGFTPYDEMRVKPGDTIVWRMVAICTNPAP